MQASQLTKNQTDSKSTAAGISSGVHTFVAQDLRAAMNDARRSLGNDALIIDHERIGDRTVLRACLEQDFTSPPPAPSPAEKSPPQQALPLKYALGATEDLCGAYRFVGYSGVGKTSLLIKVLVDWVMHHGPTNAHVLSEDDSKLAGREPLKLACQLLDLELIDVSEKGAAAQFVEGCAPRSLVLIDSAAIDHRPTAASSRGINNIYVASAQHHPASIDAGMQAVLAHYHIVGMALTHVDQVFPAEEVMSCIANHQQPLYWVGTGADLPGGYACASDEVLKAYVQRSGGEVTVKNLTSVSATTSSGRVTTTV